MDKICYGACMEVSIGSLAKLVQENNNKVGSPDLQNQPTFHLLPHSLQ